MTAALAIWLAVNLAVVVIAVFKTCPIALD
jgi:hypothetical protein